MKITTHMQIKLLEQRIKELEKENIRIKSVDERPWDHVTTDMPTAFGLRKEQTKELEDMIKYWIFKYQGNSFIFQLIMESPVPEREKIFMTFILCTLLLVPEQEPPKPDKEVSK